MSPPGFAYVPGLREQQTRRCEWLPPALLKMDIVWTSLGAKERANHGAAGDEAASTPSYPCFLAARLKSQRKGNELRGSSSSSWKQDPFLGYVEPLLAEPYHTDSNSVGCDLSCAGCGTRLPFSVRLCSASMCLEKGGGALLAPTPAV